jgi:hypothetical protein
MDVMTEVLIFINKHFQNIFSLFDHESRLFFCNFIPDSTLHEFCNILTYFTKYEGRLKSSSTGCSAQLLCCVLPSVHEHFKRPS